MYLSVCLTQENSKGVAAGGVRLCSGHAPVAAPPRHQCAKVLRRAARLYSRRRGWLERSGDAPARGVGPHQAHPEVVICVYCLYMVE